MTHPAVLNALKAGLLEPCVILDGDGREVRGYRPTEHGVSFRPRAAPVGFACLPQCGREYTIRNQDCTINGDRHAQ
jgi:hypothetical protein